MIMNLFLLFSSLQILSNQPINQSIMLSYHLDLIRLIQPDLDNFDPRIWIVAVSIVLGTFVILAIGLCIVLTRECYQSSQAGTETNSPCVKTSYQNINNNNTPLPLPPTTTTATIQHQRQQQEQPCNNFNQQFNQDNEHFNQIPINDIINKTKRIKHNSSKICYNNHHHIVVIVDVVDGDETEDPLALTKDSQSDAAAVVDANVDVDTVVVTA